MLAESSQPRSAMPRHLAVIMDGNGRWAKQRNRPRTLGHRVGARAVNLCVDFCLDRGIGALTLFAFSSENWRRPQDEVTTLMQLFLRALDREVSELHRRGIRLRFIGARTAFPDELQRRMTQAEAITADNPGLLLTIAANYGGRWDIAQAAASLAREAAAGRLDPDSIGEAHVAKAMCMSDVPEPDLFIRTGGEHRISNFLLWQLAYTELYFTDVLWPDLSASVLEAALSDFAGRQRRFGRTSDQIDAAATP